MAFFSSRLRRALVVTAFVIGSLIVAGRTVHYFFPDDWRPVEATVLDTYIQSTSGRSPRWSLFANAAYEVSGRRYEAPVSVFSDYNRSQAEAEQANWPPGRTFPIYFDANNPGSASRFPDGGREGLTVAVILLTLVAMAIATPFVIAARRRRRAASRAV